MPSQLKSDTARANGAKSKGPKTAETREKSSRNSLKHGITARHNMLLECEDPALFQQVVDEYTAVYQPANAVERDLVEEIIGAKWRIRRLKIIEVALMDYEMADKQEEIKKKLTRFDFGIHMAVSFKGLSDGSRSASLLSRYESRLHRISLRAHQTFIDVRRAIAAGLLAQPLAPEAPQLPPPAPPAPEPPASEPPAPQSETPDDNQRPAPAKQQPRLRHKKFNNEPTILRVLRKIRNHRALNAAFRRSRTDRARIARGATNN